MIAKFRIRKVMEAVGFEYQKGGWMYLRGDLLRKSQLIVITLSWDVLVQIAVAAGIKEIPLFDGYLWKTFEWLENRILPKEDPRPKFHLVALRNDSAPGLGFSTFTVRYHAIYPNFDAKILCGDVLSESGGCKIHVKAVVEDILTCSTFTNNQHEFTPPELLTTRYLWTLEQVEKVERK